MLKLINASHITDDLAQHSAPTTNNSHTIRLVIMEDTKDDQEECVPRAASSRARLLVQWGFAAGDLVYGLCRPLPVKLQTPHYTPPAGPPLPPFSWQGYNHTDGWSQASGLVSSCQTHTPTIVTGTNKDTHNTNKVGVPARLTVLWGFAARDLVYGLCCPLPVKLQTPHGTVSASPPS